MNDDKDGDEHEHLNFFKGLLLAVAVSAAFYLAVVFVFTF